MRVGRLKRAERGEEGRGPGQVEGRRGLEPVGRRGFARGLEGRAHLEGGVVREGLSGLGPPKIGRAWDAGHLKGGVPGKSLMVSGAEEKLEAASALRGGPRWVEVGPGRLIGKVQVSAKASGKVGNLLG